MRKKSAWPANFSKKIHELKTFTSLHRALANHLLSGNQNYYGNHPDIFCVFNISTYFFCQEETIKL